MMVCVHLCDNDDDDDCSGDIYGGGNDHE